MGRCVIRFVLVNLEDTLKDKRRIEMRLLTLFFIGLLLMSFALSNGAEGEDELNLKVNRLSDRAIVISTEYGSGPQVVLASSKGLVVMSTLWSPGIASQYRRLAEREFGRNDVAYVLNDWDRLDVVGGNGTYPEAVIVAHERCRENLIETEQNINHHINELIDMWQWKASLSEERLENYEPGTEDAKSERVWLAYCRRIAMDLSEGYELVLPNMTFKDQVTFDLGDMTLKVYFFGRASYESGLILHVPEEKLLFTGFLFQTHHLAPTPNRSMAEIDVPRWLEILNTVLADETAVERVVCGPGEVHPRDWLVARRDYIRQLWEEVSMADEAGFDLETIQDRLSLETKFSYLKNVDTYVEGGHEWTEREHTRNVRLFWAQLQTFAAQVVEKTIRESGIEEGIRKYNEIKTDERYYFDESSFNTLGYELLGEGNIREAIEIFKLNVQVYPDSWNAYDSLGEAYMENGDRELAIQNYNTSLELNPQNTNGVEMLKRLRSE